MKESIVRKSNGENESVDHLFFNLMLAVLFSLGGGNIQIPKILPQGTYNVPSNLGPLDIVLLKSCMLIKI